MASEKYTKYPDSFAVITGASSGIGLELAKQFAKNGFDLLIAAEGEDIHTAADELRIIGKNVEAVQVDLATKEGVHALLEKIKSMPGTLDSVAINAGVGVGGEFISTKLEEEINMIQLNVVSLVHLTKHILPMFTAQRFGRILFTSSLAAEMPGPYYAVYAATKAFVQSFVEAIRFELKDTGIVITSLQPGATDTNFFARANMLDTKANVSKKDDPADVAEDGFKALMSDKDHVVAGSFMNAAQSTMAKFMTEEMGSKAQAASTKPGSGH